MNFFFPEVVRADDCIGGGEGLGPIAKLLCSGQADTAQETGNILNKILSTVLGFLTIVAAIWFMIQFIIAGFNWISAGGDKNNTQAARQKMTNAVIGLVIVIFAWVFVALIGKVLGIDILDPGAMLQNLKIK